MRETLNISGLGSGLRNWVLVYYWGAMHRLAPKLNATFETSVSGLPASAMSFGPVFRFVVDAGIHFTNHFRFSGIAGFITGMTA
jgi:hypothetical protein